MGEGDWPCLTSKWTVFIWGTLELAAKIHSFFVFSAGERWASGMPGKLSTTEPRPTPSPNPVTFFFDTGSCYVAQAGLELVILLPLPAKCWDYRCMPPCLAPLIHRDKQ
jgi:hypothetical protein